MMAIGDRTGLLSLAARQAPSPACRRAFVTGKVELLGGFQRVSILGIPGWILRVTTKHGRVYLLAVTAHQEQHEYRVREIESVPWHWWVGTDRPAAEYDIYRGDHPDAYTVIKRGADAGI